MARNVSASVATDDYIPLNQCSLCGRDFTSVAYFDQHRIGKHEYLFSSEHPDGRRCADEDEILASGLRQMTDEEMSGKYASRIGSGVPLYHDPAKTDDTRKHFSAPMKPTHATQ